MPAIDRVTTLTVAARRRIGAFDPFGLGLSTTRAAGDAFSSAVLRLLQVESGAEGLLEEAIRLDPDFSLAHGVLATVLAERAGDPVRISALLHRARETSHRAGDREASFVTCAVLWCADGLSGDASLVRHVRTWPRDAYAVSLLVPSISSGGVTDCVYRVWSLIDELAAGVGDAWWLSSLRAFGCAERRRWLEAEDLALGALEAQPGAGHAAHALAHVLYETGRHEGAVDWIDDWLAGPGRRQEFRGHFAWHAALVELVAGDHDAVERRFDRELAPLVGNRMLVDGGSIVARAALHGHPLGPGRRRWVAAAAGEALRAPSSPFLAWNAAVFAAIGGDAPAVQAIEVQARTLAQRGRARAEAWSQVAVVCRALREHGRGRLAFAADLLRSLGDTSPLGGSPAQRELLEDLALRWLAEAGHRESAALLAAERLERRPSAFDAALRDGRVGRPAATLQAGR